MAKTGIYIPPQEGMPKRTKQELAEFDRRFEAWAARVHDAGQEMCGSYNALIHTNPKKAIKVLMLLEQQETINHIEATCHVNGNTVRRLRERFQITLQEGRKQFSRKFAVITDMSSKLIMRKLDLLGESDEELMKVPLKDLTITMAIASEKGSQLDGIAGTIVEHRTGSTVDDAFQQIKEAKARIAEKIKSQAIEAEVIDY